MLFYRFGQSEESLSLKRHYHAQRSRRALVVEAMEPRQLLSSAVPTALAGQMTNAVTGETISLDPSTTYQTIQGWLGIASMQGTSAFQQTQALEMLVNDLGLTGLRLEAPSGNLIGQTSWEATPAEDLSTFANTGAPANSSYSAFDTASTDTNMTDVVIPFENLVNARQPNSFTLYTSQSFYNFGGSGHIPTWMAGNPGEYAENLVSFDEYLKSKYGVVPTYMTILNEEDNQTHMTPALNAAIIRAVGPLLQEAGLSTKILAGETVGPSDVTPAAPAASNYVSSLTPDDWRYIAGISYHDYGQSNAAQAAAYAEAQSQGVFASEDESTDGNALLMYNDLVSGSTSFSMPQYGMFGLGSSATTNTGSLLNGGIDLASIQPGESYFDFRQMMDYVRPGAVRIGDSSADNNIESMAFQDNGQITTILINQANNGNNYTPVAKVMTITGLPNGTYGVSASIGASKSAPGTPEELGDQTVTDGTLTLTDPANSVLTVYPRQADVTLAPYIYQSSATAGSATYLLTGGSTSISLKATAIDPQLDAMSYNWDLVSAPAGANVSLVNPNSASATANGLTVAGQYVFNVTVSNGTSTSTRQVGFNVFAGPQQPIVEIVENRSPPSGSVPASIGPILHLPNETSTQLWAQLAYDLQGDAVTGTWSYVSGPAGASPTLTNENISGLPAGYIASDLTVAGNYDFRLTATDGVTAPMVQDLIVTVDAANPATSLTDTNASGAYLSPGTGQLKATVTDANGGGQWSSSWWDVLSQPAGSNVSFTDQTSPNTHFSVDTAGQYQFQLYSVDQTLAATTAVVTVNIPAVGPSTPTIAGINPSVGSPAGGTQVTISGTNFTGVTAVLFGSTNAANFVVNSATSITAASPPGQWGAVDVTVVNAAGASPPVAADRFTFDAPPTVTTPASSTPNPVNGPTANLSVLGADDGGEANLTYTWATTGAPLAPVSFTANSSNAAKNTVAGFTAAGTYNFQVTITDASGLTTTSAIVVTVNSTRPLVTGVEVNGDNSALAGVQRSIVDSIVYSFSEAVNISGAAATIAVHSGQPGTAPTLTWTAINPDSDGSARQWAVSFSGSGVIGNSIANGVYDISLNTADVTSDANPAVTVQSRPTDTFFRLFGDINGNGVVNAADNFQLKTALSTYSAAFDYNNDGVVNAADNFQFKNSMSLNFASSGIVYTI